MYFVLDVLDALQTIKAYYMYFVLHYPCYN